MLPVGPSNRLPRYQRRRQAGLSNPVDRTHCRQPVHLASVMAILFIAFVGHIIDVPRIDGVRKCVLSFLLIEEFLLSIPTVVNTFG